MGIFSFLTGKDKGVADRSIRPDERVPSRRDDPQPAPVEKSVDPIDTPFTPPEAWNTEALTAPHPPASGGAPEIGPVDASVTVELQPKIVEALKTVFDP